MGRRGSVCRLPAALGDAILSMRGTQVRIGLFAGGRWIRTRGPALKRPLPAVVAILDARLARGAPRDHRNRLSLTATRSRNRNFADSPLEGNGFELPVPRHCRGFFFRPLTARQRSGTESSQSPRWREVDSNRWYRCDGWPVSRRRPPSERARVRRSAESLAVQAEAASLVTSKLYTRAVLPPAILACSSSGTPAKISARICRDCGNVDSLCG